MERLLLRRESLHNRVARQELRREDEHVASTQRGRGSDTVVCPLGGRDALHESSRANQRRGPECHHPGSGRMSKLKCDAGQPTLDRIFRGVGTTWKKRLQGGFN